MKAKNKALLSTAILGVLFASQQSFGYSKKRSKDMKYKCKGIATQFVNSCGTSEHKCAGKASSNFDEKEWLYVMNKKACDDIQMALKNPIIKDYVKRIRSGTETAVKRGKAKKS